MRPLFIPKENGKSPNIIELPDLGKEQPKNDIEYNFNSILKQEITP